MFSCCARAEASPRLASQCGPSSTAKPMISLVAKTGDAAGAVSALRLVMRILTALAILAVALLASSKCFAASAPTRYGRPTICRISPPKWAPAPTPGVRLSSPRRSRQADGAVEPATSPQVSVPLPSVTATCRYCIQINGSNIGLATSILMLLAGLVAMAHLVGRGEGSGKLQSRKSKRTAPPRSDAIPAGPLRVSRHARRGRSSRAIGT
jgi:hypothetical protein